MFGIPPNLVCTHLDNPLVVDELENLWIPQVTTSPIKAGGIPTYKSYTTLAHTIGNPMDAKHDFEQSLRRITELTRQKQEATHHYDPYATT